MRTQASNKYFLPFFLLVLAASIFLYADHIHSRYRWLLVTVPIDLKIGVTKIPNFQVDLRTKYVIKLVSDRYLPTQELDCLLGTSFGVGGECKGVESPIDLSWHLTSGGATIASGSSRKENGASLGKYISRYIGDFVGEPGLSYELEVNSLRDASILASGNPRIVVSINDMEYKNHIVNSQALGTVAVLVAFTALIRFSVLIISYLRSRRSSET